MSSPPAARHRSVLPALAAGQRELERAFNTSVDTSLDIQPPVGAGKFTHALTHAIPILRIGGIDYREFLLDVNQTDNGPISLNQVQLFQSNRTWGCPASPPGCRRDHDAAIAFGSLAPIFQINNRQNTPGGLTTNTEIAADSGSGSGTADMFLYVPNSLFANSPTSYITLFSQLGTPTGTYDANAGYEEWAVREGVPDRRPCPSPPRSPWPGSVGWPWPAMAGGATVPSA